MLELENSELRFCDRDQLLEGNPIVVEWTRAHVSSPSVDAPSSPVCIKYGFTDSNDNFNNGASLLFCAFLAINMGLYLELDVDIRMCIVL